MLLVVFDLLNVVATFFDGDLSRFLLVVKRVGGDDFPLQRRKAQQQGLRTFQLAVFPVSFFFEQCAMASGAPVS